MHRPLSAWECYAIANTPPTACLVGLHTVPGVVRMRVRHHLIRSEDTPYSMAEGTMVVEAWGGDAQSIQAMLDSAESSMAIKAILVHREASWWDRARGWLRWRWWSLAIDPS